MEITIKKILEKTPSGVNVWFESELGRGKAEWYGSIPRIGAKYFIEFGIDEKFIKGDNFVKSTSNNSFIEYSNNKLVLEGKVDQIHKDGVIILRLDGPSSSDLIMIEFENPNLVKEGDFIRIMTDRVKLFDINL